MKRPYYLHQFEYFDGDANITFNLVDVNTEKREIIVAVTNRGKISVQTFDLLEKNENLYFEYGVGYSKIELDHFEEVNE